MRTLLVLALLLGAVACRKQHDETPPVTLTLHKLEWHVYAGDTYSEPWLDAMTARVQIRIYKNDTARRTSQTIWDTTFTPRTIRNYPLLPQKYILKKELPVQPTEKLQVWFNIRYEMNGAASETGQLRIVTEPFTFVDVRI